jgi:hypothetical protein
MSKGAFVIHVTDEPAVKKLMSLISGVLAGGYGEMMSKLGIRSEQIWLAQTKEGPALMVVLDADDPAEAIRAFMLADDPPISIWVREATGNSIELEAALERPMELLLDLSVD